MKFVGMAWIRILGFGLLLGLSGGAWGQAVSTPPLPKDSRPPHGPRPPAQQRTLTLEQLRALVERAAQIVPELRSGEPVRRSVPGAGPGADAQRPGIQRPGIQRPAVPLSYQGAVVAFAYLTPQGDLADLASGSALPGTVNLDPLPQAAPDLAAQLARLDVSGLVRLTGPHARVSLILDGRAVAELNFDRQGRLVPVRADRPVPGGKKEPGKKGP